MDRLTALQRLTPDAVRCWVDDYVIFKRGLRYQEKGAVRDMRWTSNGLVARVSGTRSYTTEVPFDRDGLAWPECSCPFDWGPICKHAVAVALEAAERVAAGALIPGAGGPSDLDPPSVLSGGLQRWLQQLEHDELVELLLDLAEDHPRTRADLTARYERVVDPLHLAEDALHSLEESKAEEPQEDAYATLLRNLQRLFDDERYAETLDLFAALYDSGHYSSEHRRMEARAHAALGDPVPLGRLEVEAFFVSPRASAIPSIRDRLSRSWPELQAVLGHFMITGVSPLHEDYDGPPWTLGALRGAPPPSSQVRFSRLLEDAISEALTRDHVDDAQAWFDAAIEHRPAILTGPIPLQLAEHLIDTDARRAFGLWFMHIEALLRAPKPTTASLTAVVLQLRELKALMQERGHEVGWEMIIADLRALHGGTGEFLALADAFGV